MQNHEIRRRILRHERTETGNRTIHHNADEIPELVETDSRRPLQRGDHVHATPYWNLTSKVSRPIKPLSFRTWNRYPEGYPWPDGYVNANGTTSEVYSCTFTLNAQVCLDVPSLRLPPYDEALVRRLTQLADTKALGNVRRALANLPMLFKERKETLRMIGKRGSDIAKSATSAQRRSVSTYRSLKGARNKRAFAKAVADEHLELIFGWLPLMAEVEGAAEYLQREQLDFIRGRGIQAERDTTSSKTEHVVKFPSAFTSSQSGNREVLRTNQGSTLIDTTSVRTALRYKLSSEIVGDAYALGADPIATLFDMIPLSFVTGWVSNLDFWVRTLTPEVGMTFETGSRNLRRDNTYQVRGIVRRNNADRWFGNPVMETVDASGQIRRNDRSVLTEPPVAKLMWDVDVGLFEVTAGVSLMLQRYLKPLKRSIAQRPFKYRGKTRYLPPIRYSSR
ncbi:MAG: putative maturation protein [Leviviridae sp.]|nr:MAG: putative maturation protein [Leviviridae sp.]